MRTESGQTVDPDLFLIFDRDVAPRIAGLASAALSLAEYAEARSMRAIVKDRLRPR